MSYDNWKTTAPDPGTVETDDRCPSCSARDGEQCDPDCQCGACQDSRREDFEDLDPDLYCLTHGKELPMGPYGVRYGGCEDCEPGEPDGEAFRGGEAAAYERETQARIQRELK